MTTPEKNAPPVPDTMVELLELALDDGDRIYAQEDLRQRIRPISSVYHGWCPSEGCAVCVAGMLIIGSLRSPIDEPRKLEDHGHEWHQALRVVDRMRFGMWEQAFGVFYGEIVFPGQRYANPVGRPATEDMLNCIGGFHTWDGYRSYAERARRIMPQIVAWERDKLLAIIDDVPEAATHVETTILGKDLVSIPIPRDAEEERREQAIEDAGDKLMDRYFTQRTGI